MGAYLSPNEILTILENRAIHGEKLVVLRSSQWKEVLEAYWTPLLQRINKDALIFHPVKDVNTKETLFCIDDGVFPPGFADDG